VWQAFPTLVLEGEQTTKDKQPTQNATSESRNLLNITVLHNIRAGAVIHECWQHHNDSRNCEACHCHCGMCTVYAHALPVEAELLVADITESVGTAGEEVFPIGIIDQVRTFHDSRKAEPHLCVRVISGI